MLASLRKFTVFLVSFVLVACSGPDIPSRQPILEPSARAFPAATAERTSAMPAPRTGTLDPEERSAGEIAITPEGVPLIRAEEPNEQENFKTKYRLDAVLDYANHHLSVREHILFTNRSQDNLDDLLLVVEPSRYPDVFHLHEVAIDDRQSTEYERDLGLLRIFLAQPLPPGEQINISLNYELKLPSPDTSMYGRPVPFGYSPRQTNLVDWYPFLPPYVDGQGWLAHPAGAFGEHLVYEAADFEVSIQLLEPNQDLVIAASAPADKEGNFYRYQHESARNFAWSVSHMYEVKTEEVGDVTVMGYSFPVHPAAGEAALKTTAQSLALYTQLFGAYPHKMLSVVEADFLDGMEYDGLYFLSNGFYNLYTGYQGEYLVAIAAHETAHQWFYGLVGNDQAYEPWLDEALCTYSERLYYEHIAPQALDWWYRYRVNYYNPRGWVDGSVYNAEGYRSYRDAVYLNGALFLDDLRESIGDQAFFAFLRDYVAEFSHEIASEEEFFDLLKKQTGSDITDLLQLYFSKKY